MGDACTYIAGRCVGDLIALGDTLTLNSNINTGTYVAGSMQWRLNAGAFNPLTDAADADQGAALVDRVQFSLAQLGAGQDIAFRFQVTVNPGTVGLNLGNRAMVSSDEIVASDTNLVQIPIDGDANVTGHLFIDLDGNGVQGAGEPNLANVDVVVTDEDGGVQPVSTDALGNYTVTVPADNALLTGQTILDVDETDADFPNGATLTTGNDPQTVFARVPGYSEQHGHGRGQL